MDKKSKILIYILLIGFSINAYADCKVIVNLPMFKNSPYHINYKESALNEYQGELLYEGIINEEGNFASKLSVSQPVEATLYIGTTFFKIWIGEGNLIISSIDSNLVFNGSLAAENRFMYNSKFMQPYLIPNPLAYKASQINTYISQWNTLQDQRLEFLEQEKKNGLSDNFVKRMQNEILNSTIYAKNQFPLLQSISKEDVPYGYYDFWNSFQILEDNPSQKAYMNALLDFAEFKTKERFPHKTENKAELIRMEVTFLDSILSKKPRTLEAVKGELISFLIKYYDEKEVLEELRENFLSAYPASLYSSLINKKWVEKESRKNKKISFSLKNMEGEEVRVDEFLGKLVYVDFWGSWCKACLEEMPSAEKLRKTFEGRDVIFLYLNFYDSRSQWLNAVKAHGIGGVNLKVEDGDLPYFNEFFGISQGFPRYAIIDREGFLTTTAAPSPSDKTIVEFIELALKN